MGPRARARGIVPVNTAATPTPPMLQWSHALARVESNPWESVTPPVHLLQWGHALARVESLFARAASHEDRARFNGATRSRAWNRQPGAQALRPVQSFNGATRSRAWNRNPRRTDRPCAARFNGATRSRAWNHLPLSGL